MSKFVGLACTAVLLLLAAKPQNNKNDGVNETTGVFAKYKTVAAYEIRPGILMMPRYTEDGQVCEIGLERRHYSPEMIRLDSILSREDIAQIVDELVPAAERGPKYTGPLERGMIDLLGSGMVMAEEYQNVSINTYSAVSPKSRKHEIVADDIAAAIKWKNRKCQ